jgi:hypothetical protein
LPPGLPHLSLMAGDRLGPHSGLMDIGEGFDDLDFSAGAVRVLFWRPEREFITRHRNPMFDIEIGLTPHRTLTVDALHCLYLGVLLDVCKAIVWWLIVNGKWGAIGTLFEQVQVAAMRIRHDFESWMRDRRRSNPGEILTRVFLGWKKFGTHSERKLRLKAAETYSFFLFLLHALTMDGDRWGDIGRRYRSGLESIKRIIDIFRAAGTVMTEVQIQELPPYNVSVRLGLGSLAHWCEDLGAAKLCQLMSSWLQCFMMYLEAAQECFEAYKAFLRMTDEDSEVPKRHMMLHLLKRLGFFGNPRSYATWRDEALNKMLKASCQSVSQATFEQSVLGNMCQLLAAPHDRVGRQRH